MLRMMMITLVVVVVVAAVVVVPFCLLSSNSVRTIERLLADYQCCVRHSQLN